MPRRYWTHDCCGEPEVNRSEPDCPECGRRGTFQGWRLSMIERMAVYSRAYGLKSTGPHRRLADRLLGDLRIPCVHCDGSGIGGNMAAFAACWHCEGGGGIWTASDAELREAYRRILREYPDAMTSDGPLPGFWC